METEEQRINVSIIKLMDINTSSSSTISCGGHTTDEEEEEDTTDVVPYQSQQTRNNAVSLSQLFPSSQIHDQLKVITYLLIKSNS